MKLEPFTLAWWLELYGICVASQVLAHNDGRNDKRAAEMTVWISNRIINKYGE